MPTVRPLTLDLLRRQWLRDVPSPPHDALSPDQRRAHLETFPMSYLGVTRAPEDFDAEPGQSLNDLLNAGRRSLERLIENNVFDHGVEAQYFIYRLSIDDHQQTGLVCGVTVADYDDSQVRVHEQVKVDRVDHLANHLSVVGAQSSPIALASRDQNGTVAELIRKSCVHEPTLDIITLDGLHQQVWRVTDPDLSRQLTKAVSAEPLYLIDGHHRAAAAAQHLHGSEADGTDRPGDQWMLSTVFPANEMRNMAFHRVVTVTSPITLINELQSRFDLRPASSLPEVVNRDDDVMAVGCLDSHGRMSWFLLHLPTPNDDLNVVKKLDQSRLADEVLGPLLEIDEANPDGRLRYLPGLADEESLDHLHIAIEEVIFVMSPVTMDQLVQASDEGLVMPPKSTYFEPKVRSGLFVHFKERV